MSKLPKRFEDFRAKYPKLTEAYRELGEQAAATGPLGPKERAIAKLGIALAAGLEGGTHSQVRKALDAGLTPDEIRHVALLSVTTLGFPSMMKALSWIEDVLERSSE